MHSLDFQKEEFTEKEKRNIDILEILRKRGPISRPDISKEIGINVVTICNYIDEFKKTNLVVERELDRSEGGRRPTLIDLNSQGGYVIGVGLNLMNLVGVLVDLKGNIITKTQVSRPRASVNEITECLLEIIREILRRSKEYTADIKGIGIGIAGLINKKDGTIHWPQKMDHYYAYASVDISLKELVEREFDLPTLIENDATCACFGEYWYSLDSRIKNLIYMFSGVGCGMIFNGQLYKGSQGYAGEVSIYNYKEQDYFNCSAGNSCFIKRWEMDLGIVADLRASLAKDKAAAQRFFEITSVNPDNADLKSVFIAAQSKDAAVSSILDQAAKRLGIKIASLVNLLNPEMVIVGGGLEEAGDDFLNRVCSTVREWSFRETVNELKIGYSQLRENSVALGASGLVMQRVFAGL